MKTLIFFCAVMVAVFAATPVSALVYDDFEAKVIDPDKWLANESAGAGMDILESGRTLKTEPVYGFKGLNILQRSYAAEGSNTGSSGSYNRLLISDGLNITTIQTTVLVKKIQATECSSNTAATEPRARIGGMLFNTGVSTPGDSTNDVFVFIAVGRPTNSQEPAGVLNIYGVASLCTNANCSTNTQLDRVEVGTVKVGQKVKLRITWATSPTNRFVFQKGKAAEVVMENPVTVGNAPGTPNGGNKRLEVHNLIPNCTSTPRPMAFMEAFFDDIVVLP